LEHVEELVRRHVARYGITLDAAVVELAVVKLDATGIGDIGWEDQVGYAFAFGVFFLDHNLHQKHARRSSKQDC
jgi:hypothetical protein